ncbi:MAG: hypothetical protein ABW185_27605, partial [Sedimenticola sp.]
MAGRRGALAAMNLAHYLQYSIAPGAGLLPLISHNKVTMTTIDVFNGDADGICALLQLRLAEPK